MGMLLISLIIWVLPSLLLFALSLHESAHGWMASRLGDQTARMLGRVTLNPLKHIDRVGKLHDCIAYGPGILDLAHQPDEYVVIDDMVNSAQVMALAARALLYRTA